MKSKQLLLFFFIIFTFSFFLYATEDNWGIDFNNSNIKFTSEIRQAEEYYSQGQEALAKHDILKAGAYLQKAANIFHRLGDLTNKEETLQEAYLFYLIAVEFDPYNKSLHKKIGDMWFMRWQNKPNVGYLAYATIPGTMVIIDFGSPLSNARNSYETAFELGINDAEIQLKLGVMYHEAGNTRKALTHFLVAFAGGKETFEIFYNIAQCYLELNKFDKAIEFFEKASELEPLDTKVLFMLAQTWYQKYDHDTFNKDAKLQKSFDYLDQIQKLNIEKSLFDKLKKKWPEK